MSRKKEKNNLPSLLRKLRGDRSRETIARAVGCSLNTYTAWESGRFMPGVDYLGKLAEVYEVEMAKLIEARATKAEK